MTKAKVRRCREHARNPRIASSYVKNCQKIPRYLGLIGFCHFTPEILNATVIADSDISIMSIILNRI